MIIITSLVSGEVPVHVCVTVYWIYMILSVISTFQRWQELDLLINMFVNDGVQVKIWFR